MSCVAHLGPLYTFGHAATLEAARRGLVPDRFESVLCLSNPDIVKAVATGDASFGVLPVQNSSADVVIASMDAVFAACQGHGQPVHFSGEVILPVAHQLVGLSCADLAGCGTIMSHPHAFPQCERNLGRVGSYERRDVSSTAEAVRLVAELRDPAIMAIGSAMAAKAFGLKILLSDIHDDPTNVTRFMVLSHEDHEPTGRDSTWIAFVTKNVPGALVSALIPLKDRGINMHAIHSRCVQSLHIYRFYIGLDGHRTDRQVAWALDELTQFTSQFYILGSHPKDPASE